ncbi:hypothetical protein D3C76_1053710 [compost metagenome]
MQHGEGNRRSDGKGTGGLNQRRIHRRFSLSPFGEQRLTPPVKIMTRVGQRQAPSIPVDETDTKPTLERSQVTARCGIGNVQLLSSLTQRSQLRCLDEELNLGVAIHGLPLSFSRVKQRISLSVFYSTGKHFSVVTPIRKCWGSPPTSPITRKKEPGATNEKSGRTHDYPSCFDTKRQRS